MHKDTVDLILGGGLAVVLFLALILLAGLIFIGGYTFLTSEGFI